MSRKRQFIDETTSAYEKYTFGVSNPHDFSFLSDSLAPEEQPLASSSSVPSKRPRLDPSVTKSSPKLSKPARPFAKRESRLKKTQKIMDLLAEHDKHHLGDFLQHLFHSETLLKLSPSSQQALEKWIQGGSRVGTRPAEIVDAIYRHPSGLTRYHNVLSRATFSDLLPPADPPSVTNAHPQHVSLLPNSSTALCAKQTNSREGLEELMARGTLSLVECEAQMLADPRNGLNRSAGMTWDDIDSLSRENQEQTIRDTAPLIWAIFSTISLARATSTGTNDHAGQQKARSAIPAIIFTISMLISFRHLRVNFLQAVMAVFLFACNTHNTLHGHLNRLGDSAIQKLQEVGTRAYQSACNLPNVSPQFFLLVFDNVNKFHLARKQTVSSKNQMKNGTAATMILLEDVPPGALDPKPYWDNVSSQLRQSLTVEQLLDNIDPLHLESIGTGMILRILISHVPSLSQKLRTELEERFKHEEDYAKHRLRLRKSATLSMGTSSIDESTAAGASEILDDLVSVQMKMDPSWFDHLLILVCGDQLTVDRLRKAIRYKATEKSVYKSRSWALPLIQLWHMKVAYLRSIFKVHWFPKVGSRLFGLRQSVDALGRSLNADKCDFYPCHHAVKTVFDGMVLTATYTFLQEQAGAPVLHSDHMLAELDKHFAPGGRLANCSLAQLDSIASAMYNGYMTTEAYRRTLPPTTDLSVADIIHQELQFYHQDLDYTTNASLRSTHHGSGGDQLLGNLTSGKRTRSPELSTER
ncbi:hypothetical protein FRC06_001900 [Ceratobasidium sp. 370]|nr:hypothetical protein FRC06_001900 [Ceratobasidium sp. 370]